MIAVRRAPRFFIKSTLMTARVGIPFTTRALDTHAHSQLLDVTREIKVDHDNVRELFARFKQVTNQNEKTRIANTLVREMSIHGDAEEASVYDVSKRLGFNDTINHNQEEHIEIRRLVWKAEHSATDLDNYDAILSDAVNAFLDHATDEERIHHPMIRRTFTAEQNDKIARAFIAARDSVPSRFHPLALQTSEPMQEVIDMHGNVPDKMIQSVQESQYVQLRFGHPQI